MNTLIVVLSVALATVILWSAICVVNHMDHKTPFLRRLGFVLLGTGAAGMILAPFYLQRSPTPGDVILLLAVTVLSWTERAKLHRSPQVPHTH